MVRIAILRLLETYFRHRWLYLGPIALLTLASAGFILVSQPDYITSGVIYVQSGSFLGSLTSVRDVPFTYNTPAQETANQIMDLMQTNAFVRSVIQDTQLEEEMDGGEVVVGELIDEARGSIWAQTIGGNQVAIYAIHTDAVLAYELSNAVINRYVQWQINLDQVQSGTAEDFMDDLVVTYGSDVEEARENLQIYLEAHPEPTRGDRSETEQLEIDRLQSILDLAGQRYSRALEQQEGARLATIQAEADVRQTFFVVDAPAVPSAPEVSRRQQAVTAAVFVAAGAILAAVAVVGAALLDQSFRFPLDVAHGLSLPVLAMVPDSRPKPGRFAFLRRSRTKPAAREISHTNRSSALSADDEPIEAAA